MPYFDIDRTLKIHYLDPHPGGHPAVLLLHGLGATGESWQLQFPVLIESGYRPIAADARGFGKSTYPGGKMTVEDMAGDMVALLAKLNVDGAVVVGIENVMEPALRILEFLVLA